MSRACRRIARASVWLAAGIVPLLAIAVWGTFSLASPRSQPRARVLPAMVKVRAGERLPPGASAIELSAARGECEGAQVAVAPPIAELFAEASPLRSKQGSVLEARLYREAFVECAEGSNFEGIPGRWPDPLIPARDVYRDETRSAFPFSSESDPLIVYFEVCVPEAATPGRYEGALTLRARGLPPLSLPARLTVRRFSIPATSTLTTSFGFSGLTAVRGHGLAGSEVGRLTRLYSEAALRHRISLHGMTMEPPSIASRDPWRLDFAAWDAEVGPLLDGLVLPSGARFTSIDVRLHPQARDEQSGAPYLREYAKHLRERGWLDRAFIYAKDEPRPEDLPLVRRIGESAHRADPGLRVLVTTSLTPSIQGAVDILAPNINCLFARPGDGYCHGVVPAARYREVRSRGSKLWWYQSCGSHGCGPVPALDRVSRSYFSGWPSYMVDHDGALNRAMGTLAFVHGIEGELYFNTVEAWIPGKAGEPADPWRSLWRFHGNGDGTLFFPGTPQAIGGSSHVPVESLRLKHIRDGLEDYEYLALARKLGLEAQASAAARRLAPLPYEIVRDPAEWARAREALAAAIERANDR